MRSALLKMVAISMAIAVPVAAAGVALWPSSTTTGVAPESMRAELSKAVVAQWSSEGARAARTTPDAWAKNMRATLAQTDIANLEQAASANNFVAMSQALGGQRPAESSEASAKFGTPGSDLVYTPITPCRIVDTRSAGGPISAGESRSFEAYNAVGFAGQGGVVGDCNLPANASAVTVKVTASRPVGDGFLTVYPFNETRPLASSLNYLANVDTSNESHFKLCRPGCTSQFTVYSFQQTNVVVDVNGYFTEPEATALDCTVAQQSGNLDLLGGLQPRSVSCPAGYSATGGGCGGPLGLTVNNSQPLVSNGAPVGWQCDLVGSLLSVLSYQVSATCCRTPGR